MALPFGAGTLATVTVAAGRAVALTLPALTLPARTFPTVTLTARAAAALAIPPRPFATVTVAGALAAGPLRSPAAGALPVPLRAASALVTGRFVHGVPFPDRCAAHSPTARAPAWGSITVEGCEYAHA